MTERLWAPWRMEYIQGGADAPGCIFCDKAASSDDEADLIVRRGQRAYVLLNLYPYSNGHLMVAPVVADGTRVRHAVAGDGVFAALAGELGASGRGSGRDERSVGLEQTNESVIAHKQNDILRLLTVFSVILLPLTLLSGIFGMNFHHIPFTQNYHGFIATVALMVAIAVVMLAFFRIKRWI